ncbi:hypothetical protein B0H13DRAFT_2392561 [Mycena leptocephala]|nr:hypothetical protein B0H13DRAFT_2392561 [Mycena leptocephala]
MDRAQATRVATNSRSDDNPIELKGETDLGCIKASLRVGPLLRSYHHLPAKQCPQKKSDPPVTPSSRVLSYEVWTTTIIYGLPPSEQQRILKQYRGLFHEHAAKRTCQMADQVNLTYDLACQYYKNVHALDLRGTHTDSDDSLFSDDNEGPPPLIPVSPSTGGSILEPAAEALTDSDAAPNPSSGATIDPISPWNAGRTLFWDSLGLGLSAATNSSTQRTDGEITERAWADLNPPNVVREMGPSLRASCVDGTATEVHKLEIINIHGIRNVECDCTDGLHSVYRYYVSHAFVDQDSDVVIKKSKTRLLPLN